MLNVALPQRIRAGCDADPLIRQYGLTLCLSAFARVATTKNRKQIYSQFFATAHSRGLRRDAFKRAGFNWALPQRIRAGCDNGKIVAVPVADALPQCIRAGCD